VYVHEQWHLPFLSVMSAARDRRGLSMKPLNTAGV